MPSSARKHKPLRPPGQRVAKRNARKKEADQIQFCTPDPRRTRAAGIRVQVYTAPRRARRGAIADPQAPSHADPRQRGGPLHRSASKCLSLWTVHGPFLFGKTKEKWGCIPAGQAPAGAESPPGRRSAAPPHPMPGAFAQPSPWLNPCVQWDAPPGGIYGQTS